MGCRWMMPTGKELELQPIHPCATLPTSPAPPPQQLLGNPNWGDWAQGQVVSPGRAPPQQGGSRVPRGSTWRAIPSPAQALPSPLPSQPTPEAHSTLRHVRGGDPFLVPPHPRAGSQGALPPHLKLGVPVSAAQPPPNIHFEPFPRGQELGSRGHRVGHY